MGAFLTSVYFLVEKISKVRPKWFKPKCQWQCEHNFTLFGTTVKFDTLDSALGPRPGCFKCLIDFLISGKLSSMQLGNSINNYLKCYQYYVCLLTL